MGTMSGVYNGSVIDIGRTWTFVVQNWRDSLTDVLFDLGGYTAIFVLNDTNDAVTPTLTATTSEAVSDGTIVLSTTGSGPVTANSITVRFPDVETSGLSPQRYFYELVMVPSSGAGVSLLKGTITASPRIA